MNREEATQQIAASIDARIARCNDAGETLQAKKWERERTHLVMASSVDWMLTRREEFATIGDFAIYTVEKIRKMVRYATGKGRPDNYTHHLLKQSVVAAKKKLTFTYGLQRAALSKSVDYENAHKLVRLDCSSGTANSQASTSHLALAYLGLATNVKRGSDEKSDENYTSVDFDNELVKQLTDKNYKPAEPTTAPIAA